MLNKLYILVVVFFYFRNIYLIFIFIYIGELLNLLCILMEIKKNFYDLIWVVMIVEI